MLVALVTVIDAARMILIVRAFSIAAEVEPGARPGSVVCDPRGPFCDAVDCTVKGAWSPTSRVYASIVGRRPSARSPLQPRSARERP